MPTSPRRWVKIYPLARAANPRSTSFVHSIDVVCDRLGIILRFFQLLDHMLQNQPWLGKDNAPTDTLKSIGVEKGKVFSPNMKAQDVHAHAAREAQAWLDARYRAPMVL